MAACLNLFILIVKVLIASLQFLAELSIALILDPCSAANASNIEVQTAVLYVSGIRSSKIAFADGSYLKSNGYFDFNSSTVSYANYERLASVAALLQANPSYTLKVIGYADSVGNSENNHKIA